MRHEVPIDKMIAMVRKAHPVPVRISYMANRFRLPSDDDYDDIFVAVCSCPVLDVTWVPGDGCKRGKLLPHLVLADE